MQSKFFLLQYMMKDDIPLDTRGIAKYEKRGHDTTAHPETRHHV